ncbi:hypothetical protein CBOM_01096 [Ceraceosorus bombacis]|uniref:Uncharacterized protein n=1 Tax=Ceraceosorus bombacis TaxID=401625 RepID=A0A0P1BAV4_9BASI|nr:hypothetical protein CBOM_01096 [Ceraceosorus bombacis]
MVSEKNANEEFQNFLHATVKSDVKGTVGLQAPVSKEDAKKDGETAGEAFRTLIKLFLRNGEARKLFSDLGTIGRDIFADAASFTANKTRPDEAALAQVDQPAPENEFHDDIPEALKKSQKAATDGKADAKDEAAKAADQTAQALDPNATADQNKDNVAKAAQEQKEKLLAKIPDKHKDIAKEHAEKTKNYFKENFPERRRNLFIYRLKKVLVECQRHRDYQDAMDFFLNAFESYKGHAADIAAQTEDNAKNLRAESNLATAERSFRTLIERFANGHSTQPIANALDTLYTDVKNDGELKAWFSRLDTYVRKCLQEPGYVMKDEADNEARSIREQGQRFFGVGEHEGKYKGHFDDLFKQIEIFFKAPHLWQDIRDPILPQLLTHVGRVPVPRIEFSDPTVDLVIENIAIDAQNLIPNAITIDASSHMTLSAYSKLGDEHHHQIKVQLTQIQSDMKGVKFSLRKKKGFPSLNESGTADILLGGKGLTVSAHIETTGLKTGNIFTVKSVNAKVDTLKFAIKGTKHDLAIKIFKPLATSLIKKQLAKAAEQGIRDGLVKLDQQLQDIRDAQDSGSELKSKFAKSDKGSTATNPNKGTFKLVTSRKRDSILPDLGDKHGWVNRIDERDETAGKQVDGTPDWHSPAFSIVNGKV